MEFYLVASRIKKLTIYNIDMEHLLVLTESTNRSHISKQHKMSMKILNNEYRKWFIKRFYGLCSPLGEIRGGKGEFLE